MIRAHVARAIRGHTALVAGRAGGTGTAAAVDVRLGAVQDHVRARRRDADAPLTALAGAVAAELAPFAVGARGRPVGAGRARAAAVDVRLAVVLDSVRRRRRGAHLARADLTLAVGSDGAGHARRARSVAAGPRRGVRTAAARAVVRVLRRVRRADVAIDVRRSVGALAPRRSVGTAALRGVAARTARGPHPRHQ